MASSNSGSPIVRVLGAVLLSPFYAVYGVVLLIRSVFGLGRRARGVGGALSSTLVCPNGHRSDAVGRWRCAACGGVYHGWVGRCSACGAPAGWCPCEVCGVSIRLPWSRS